MNLKDVYLAIEEIATVSSRNGKMELLRKYLEFNLFQEVVILAYHPHKRFGLVPTEERPGTGVERPYNSLDPFLLGGLLEALYQRDLTGNKAVQAVEEMYASLCPEEGIILTRILRKDLRAGFTASTVNKIKKKLIPEFKVMLAHKYDPKRIKSWPVAVQPKLDGFRTLVYVDPVAQEVKFFSRKGKDDFCDLPILREELLKLNLGENSFYLDAEITDGGFNETSSSIRTKTGSSSTAELHIFEMLSKEEFLNGSSVSQNLRYVQLKAEIEDTSFIKVIEQHLAHTDEEVLQLYADMRARGLEGIIVKPLEGTYDTKRSYNWMKIKDQLSADIKVTGFEEGEGKYRGSLGALICDFKGVETSIGMGFTDADRARFWDNPPVDQLIEVEYHEETPDGSLRHARFKGIRDDKSEVSYV